MNSRSALLILELLALVCGARGHICERECEVGKTMLCKYDFKVENYYVLSRACHLCPFVWSDCYRPHCITANGKQRNVLAVNRQVPGPTINVCEGDSLEIVVVNAVDDGQSTSIHWHGLHQRHSNHMDGVGRLTQCNIAPGETFIYRFKADNAGTHWWHAHTGLQLGDGVYGAFIVRQPPALTLEFSLYDRDVTEHVMLVAVWSDTGDISRYMEEMQDRWRVPVPIHVLVNGRGRKYAVEADLGLLGYNDSVTVPPEYTPYEVFNVTEGKRYRFRLIGAASRCYFLLMVDGHQMTVITTDGMPIVPVTVGSLVLQPGERYDVIIQATAPPGDYWIKIQGYDDCLPNANGAAILHYEGYNGDPKFTPAEDPQNFTEREMVFNPSTIMLVNEDLASTSPVVLQNETRYDSTVDESYEDEVVDKRYYISLFFMSNDNSMYSHKVYYPQDSRYGLITPTLNNITFYHHSIPLATQWDDVTDKRLCNASTLNTVIDCNDDLCHCVHMLDIKLGEVVEIFMLNQDGSPHQMHLHGFYFRLVGDGWIPGALNSSFAAENIVFQDVVEMDKRGEFPRILKNPMYKDTVTVKELGGYSIFRFKADNPGLWFFHCHNEGHLMQGMAMILKVGDPENFPVPDDDFPVCGATQKQRRQQQCSVSRGAKVVRNVALLYIATLLTCFSL